MFKILTAVSVSELEEAFLELHTCFLLCKAACCLIHFIVPNLRHSSFVSQRLSPEVYENSSRSGELRHGSLLHAGLYDLILLFLVFSFILTLDRCV